MAKTGSSTASLESKQQGRGPTGTLTFHNSSFSILISAKQHLCLQQLYWTGNKSTYEHTSPKKTPNVPHPEVVNELDKCRKVRNINLEWQPSLRMKQFSSQWIPGKPSVLRCFFLLQSVHLTSSYNTVPTPGWLSSHGGKKPFRRQ